MILFLSPFFEQKPWAGDKIQSIYDCPNETGEAWIVSGQRGKSSIILNGIYRGKSLWRLWIDFPHLFGNLDEKQFPILIKLISAKEDLSVQVHPDDSYAISKHNSLGKFECWYILEGNESKSLVVGIDAKTKAEAKSIIENDLLESKLIKREIKTGDLVVIEPGTVHALTSGSFVLEIQETSSITYRLHDYNREPKRDLHIEDSLNVIQFKDNKNPVFSFPNGTFYDLKHFTVKKELLEFDKEPLECEIEPFTVVYVLRGKCFVNDTEINQNQVVIITADEKKVLISGSAQIMIIKPKRKKASRLKMRKIALITGIAGQDGSYLTEFLLGKGYEVHGLINSKGLLEKECIRHLVNNSNIMDKYLFFHLGDMTDSSNLNRVIENVQPDEIYHLASQDHVDVSFELPEYTAEVNALGTLRLLDAIKQNGLRTKLFNESTCHLFSGDKQTAPQDENTPVDPKNPYATSKVYSHFIVKNYRDAYGIYAVNGIMFTHSSPREEDTFVARKITKSIAAIVSGKQQKLSIGNLNAMRDWGYAKDYVEGMWLSLQQEEPTDYVFASGKTHSVRQFIELAFKEVGIEIEWKGSGVSEKGYNKANGEILVEVNPKFYRVLDTFYLRGNSAKAYNKFGWQNKTEFEDLVKMMVQSDLEEMRYK